MLTDVLREEVIGFTPAALILAFGNSIVDMRQTPHRADYELSHNAKVYVVLNFIDLRRSVHIGHANRIRACSHAMSNAIILPCHANGIRSLLTSKQVSIPVIRTFRDTSERCRQALHLRRQIISA